MLYRSLREEQGAVMVTAAVMLTTLLLFAGLALDFGRAHLLRAQLQTAVDAAALAGALQVVPMVELEVERWREVAETCVDPQSQKEYTCHRTVRTSPVRTSGPEWDLIRREGWRSAISSRCSGNYRCVDDYTVVRQWLVLPDTTTDVARETFQKNATWPGGSGGATVSGMEVTVNQQKVEVTATARLRARTTFLRLGGIEYLEIHRTGSAVPVRR